jgi:hypothetical protein
VIQLRGTLENMLLAVSPVPWAPLHLLLAREKNVAATTRHIRFQPYCTRSLSGRPGGPRRSKGPSPFSTQYLHKAEWQDVRRDLTSDLHLCIASEYYSVANAVWDDFMFFSLTLRDAPCSFVSVVTYNDIYVHVHVHLESNRSTIYRVGACFDIFVFRSVSCMHVQWS